MIDQDVRNGIEPQIKKLFPLLRYLILQTETHAFCLAVAAAALLGFFPSCLVMLAILKNFLHWNAAYEAMLETVRLYIPILDPKDQLFVIRNLKAQLEVFGHGTGFSTLLWVLLGAAGVFIPFEAALNRLWLVQEDRTYWKNQLVGFTLTLVCTAVGLVFVMISTPLHQHLHEVVGALPLAKWVVHVPFARNMENLPLQVPVENILRQVVVDATTTCFFIVAIFALYKFLPNKKIDAKQVLPAAILAGVMAELVRIVYVHTVPNLYPTQGPFAISVTFMLFAYFETFVVLGCAFLASKTARYPWMGSLKPKSEPSPS